MHKLKPNSEAVEPIIRNISVTMNYIPFQLGRERVGAVCIHRL